MPKSLIEFYQDKDTKNNVQQYLIEFLKEEAVRKLFDREDVTAVAEAKDMIDKAFDNLEVMFEPKATPKNKPNESR